MSDLRHNRKDQRKFLMFTYCPVFQKFLKISTDAVVIDKVINDKTNWSFLVSFCRHRRRKIIIFVDTVGENLLLVIDTVDETYGSPLTMPKEFWNIVDMYWR